MIRRAELGKQLLLEIKPLCSKIVACTYSEVSILNDGIEGSEKVDVIVFKIKNFR
jgi:hypothetical protein